MITLFINAFNPTAFNYKPQQLWTNTAIDGIFTTGVQSQDWFHF